MRYIVYALIFLASFNLYWETQSIFDEYEKSSYFGADSIIYAKIAEGVIDQQVQFFHPLTAAISSLWLSITTPLQGLADVAELYGAMYAAIGALGVVAAAAAFHRLLPANPALICTLAYALSLSVWYFSSIHETKIIDGTIASVYIAVYLRLRENWSIWWFFLLTSIMIIGCFNSIVTAFLVLIPAIDVLLRNSFRIRELGWVFMHALPAPFILIILEFLIRSSVEPNNVKAEAENHFDLLVTFAKMGSHTVTSFFGFIQNWIVFSLAAPSADADHGYAIWEVTEGYFHPNLHQYFSNLSSGLFLLSLILIVLVGLNTVRLGRLAVGLWPLLAGLAAYSAARIVLFFIFLPSEALLYTSPIILAHLIIISTLYFQSTFRYKAQIYGFFVAMMAISNIRFMFA